jgi:hypothetical protein
MQGPKIGEGWAKELHRWHGLDGKVGNGIVNGLVVNMKDDMQTGELLPPAKDSVDDG